MRPSHSIHCAALVVILLAALSAGAQSNFVTLSVKSPVALKGVASDGKPDNEAVTVLCTVVVSNFTGQPFIAIPRPPGQSNLLFKADTGLATRASRLVSSPVPFDLSSAFDHLSLSVCDEVGITLSSQGYYWQPFSHFGNPQYVTLEGSSTTNGLSYTVFGVSPTNKEMRFRLKGSFMTPDGRSWPVTSDVQRVKLL